MGKDALEAVLEARVLRQPYSEGPGRKRSGPRL